MLAEHLEESSHPPDARPEELASANGGAGDLPTGIVTLVFTDIEGSTRLMQELGPRYEAALADHHRLIREALRRHDGREVLTVGDGFFLVFQHASDAVRFAVAAQQALTRHEWPTGLPLRVRMGMHTGEPTLAGGQYVGLSVHRAARIAAAGYGGQILVSEVTKQLADSGIPESIALRDLGMHRLKDLHQWEHLFQVVHADLPADFPRLRSIDTLPNNLPRKLTSFVGREREVAAIKDLVRTAPLVTIVGIGGAGKTRLALQAAADLLTEFRDGAWLVEIAPVSDPKQVVQAVAAAVGVRESPGLSLKASILDYLSTRHLLLIVDGCEHVVASVAEFVQTLLTTAQDVHVLCTSRESLRINGEKVWRIPSLPLPDVRGVSDLETLAQNAAVRLFAERARAVAPGFALTERNASLVAQICVRLDGVPLAIELAAARVAVLTVDQIAARLDDRFRLLAGGGRTAMPRHQTLRATMDWSYDLLSEPERALLRRLSVFAGSWTLEAAEAVCPDGVITRDAVLDGLTQLVDKSLVDPRGDVETRYAMLETIRQYAQEKLVAAREAEELRARHRDWFLTLAEEAEPHLRGPQQKAWLDRLEREWDNLQAALRWSVEGREADAAARLATALWRFWYLRGHLTVGGDWLGTVLTMGAEPSAARARILNGAAVLAFAVGNYAPAVELAERAAETSRAFGDIGTEASARLLLAVAHLARGDCAQATTLVEESLAAFRMARDLWGEALALSVVGDVALDRGEYERALSVYGDSVALFRRVGDAWGVALSERGRGFAARLLGDYDRAVSVQTASLALTRELGDRTGMGASMMQLGFLHWRQGQYSQARAVLEEALTMFREAGNRRGIADVLSVLGLVEDSQGHYARATEVLQESAEAYRAIGSRFGVAAVLGTLGRTALHEGDEARAVALAEEAVARFREIGDRRGAATSLRVLGEAALHRGDHAQALKYAEESHAIFRDLNDQWAIGYVLRILAGIALAQGDVTGARRRYAESLALHTTHRDRLGIVKCLEGLACVLTAEGRHEQAARALGSAEQMRTAIGAPRTSVEVPVYDRCMTRLREALGAPQVSALMETGRDQTAEAVLDQVLRLDGNA
ncbi:MAG: tetratricopeptide repeat protein [Armatimonadota bacterium]|nr:tetratricopeptide repeat protein [Armatimonadota bacterium]